MVKNHEDVLWDTVVLLKQQDYIENAKAVFKSLVERTFILLRQPTDFLQDANIEIPSFDQYDTFRHLDQHIHICIKNNQIERANELLIEYIELLSLMIPNVDAKKMQKQILAHLLSSDFRSSDVNAIRTFDTYTTTEVAEILNVSNQTIRRWCEKGNYPNAFQTDGGHWRIPKKHFKTNYEQAKKRNEFSRKLDEMNRQVGEVDESEYL